MSGWDRDAVNGERDDGSGRRRREGERSDERRERERESGPRRVWTQDRHRFQGHTGAQGARQSEGVVFWLYWYHYGKKKKK